MKNKRLTETDFNNIVAERFLYKRLQLLALNMFEYEGLEDLNIEERHIERFLFDHGKCIWFEDKTDGLMCLEGEGTGKRNVMNDPLEYRVTGFGYSKIIKAKDCVVMENNKLRMPTRDIVSYFTNQLYEVTRTRDVNVKTLKLPFIIGTTDKELLTAKKIIEEIDSNNFAIFSDKKAVDLDSLVKVLPTNVKCYTAELTDLYHDILNEALTYLGINNANTDKKERLITSEANANNQLIESSANLFLEARERACDLINKKFGTNISVKLRNEEVLYAMEPTTEPDTTQQQPGNE